MLAYMDKPVNFLVEESGFFASNFLVKEGLIDPERFSAMFGMVGLTECVNQLRNARSETERFGHNAEADQLGLKIIQALDQLVKVHHNQYCTFSGVIHRFAIN